MTAPLRTLQQRGRVAQKAGRLPEAASLFYQAALQTTARERDYLPVLHDFRGILLAQQLYRAALTLDWYGGSVRHQRQLLAHVPLADRARTVQSWAERDGQPERARGNFARAAEIYEHFGAAS